MPAVLQTSVTGWSTQRSSADRWSQSNVALADQRRRQVSRRTARRCRRERNRQDRLDLLGPARPGAQSVLANPWLRSPQCCPADLLGPADRGCLVVLLGPEDRMRQAGA